MDTDYLAVAADTTAMLDQKLAGLRLQPAHSFDAEMPIYVLDDVRSMPADLLADEAYEARRNWMRETGRWRPGRVEISSCWKAGELLLYAAEFLLSEGQRLAVDPAHIREALTRAGLVFREHACALGRDVADSDAEIAATFRIAGWWLVDSRKGAAA
ncbi:hypothetical protein [Rhodococcus sp. 114MFTsu3.1]|uniref:hypothetical protein n=1 Tax=Rhodococcus sp. 114MFTsu3.1 TaxID=1172184 RepID=UPI00037B852D|nr:hypothetical protein [Rhodococcus sp. 114MFTsu3.1]